MKKDNKLEKIWFFRYTDNNEMIRCQGGKTEEEAEEMRKEMEAKSGRPVIAI